MNRSPLDLATIAILVTLGTVLATECGPSTTEKSPATVEPASAESPSSGQGVLPAAANPHTSAQGESPVAAGSRTPRESVETERPAEAHRGHVAVGTPPAREALSAKTEITPAPQPPPAPVVKAIPAGTVLDVIVENGASSETSQPGQPVRVRLANDLSMDGRVVVPSGSVLEGTVVDAVPQKKIGGIAKLSLSFSSLRLSSGQVVPISAVFMQAGKSQTKKDAATIGGSAAGGALLGKILGGSTKDAAIGAVVGAAAGTAVAAHNKADAVELASGTRIALSLAQAAEVTLR